MQIDESKELIVNRAKKNHFVIVLLFSFINFSFSSSGLAEEFEQEHEHAHVLDPIQEARYYEEAFRLENFDLLNFRFEQTDWRECTHDITGNYTGFNCANRRGISVILKRFMDEYMPLCVQAGLNAIDAGELENLHVIHDGILGDRRHSPRSLHAENRAIDVSVFRVTLSDGRQRDFRFNNRSNRAFFEAFRNCWGESVHVHNGCPYYNGNAGLTGSIGWEDANHQNHMHTSVPYCLGGGYGDGYFRR